MKKLSLHHSRVLDAMTHSVTMDVAGIYDRAGGHNFAVPATIIAEINHQVRERVRLALGEAFGWGWSARDSMPILEHKGRAEFRTAFPPESDSDTLQK